MRVDSDERLNYPMSSEAKGGTWSLRKTEFGFVPVVVCPCCGTSGTLMNHDIDNRGNVSPELFCPVCGFESKIALSDWIGDIPLGLVH